MTAGDDYRLVGGTGPTSADLEELAHVERVLERAADRLDAAGAALDRGSIACAVRPLGDPAAVKAQRALIAARTMHGHAADDVRGIVRKLRTVVRLYDGAESTAHKVLRQAVSAGGNELGERPVVGAAVVGLGSAAAASTLAALAPTLVGFELLSRALHRQGPIGALAASGADGRAELALLGAASFARALRSGHQAPTLDAVRDTAEMAADALAAAAPTVVIPRTNPPQLRAPRNTSDVLANVAASYDTASPGTPPGLVSIQRLTHPDGTRAWVVEIPGTEVWTVNSSNPMDSTTNLRLMAGLPDDMTDSVVEAMERAGIGPDEPVMLAGHSQGGMVATSVAAAVGTAYTVRAVATAGSPDIPNRPPRGVEVRNYRHDEDVVPQTDGVPDVTSPDVTVLRHDLPGSPDAIQAHDIRRYITTAALPVPDDEYSQAVSSVLGPSGTTAVTLQFQATRDPAIVATIPPTIRPQH
ncbi:hypothetical protein [Cellulomonas sp. URHE0023]|uniref:hypothetical protein n=1 Tax=Cellulomonas sp. URHE0023 TaxID=1380354 RepID=UPI000481E806|nr:hypothetical protein [Cellulomonas sp. URHE0023]